MYYSKEEKERRREFWKSYEVEHKKRIRELWDKNNNLSEIVTWDIIEENPDIDWNFGSFSINENIPWEVIVKNLDKNWHWDKLSRRIPYKIIKKNPDHPWLYGIVSLNPTLTIEDVKEDLEKPWSWHNISQNYNLVKNWENYRRNKDFPWDLTRLIQNPAIIPAEAMSKNPELFENNDRRVWSSMSWNRNLTWDDVKDRLNKPWAWEGISENGKVITSFEMMRDLAKVYPICIETYSQNSSLTWENVFNNIMVDWDMEGLSSNESVVTFEIIKERKNLRKGKEWDWYFLSLNRKVATEKNVLENPEMPWNFSALSGNEEAVSWELVREHADKDWDWITVNRILQEKLIVKMMRRNMAAYRIQWHWRNYLENPNHSHGYTYTKAKLFDPLVEGM